jgi:hypothetical protein
MQKWRLMTNNSSIADASFKVEPLQGRKRKAVKNLFVEVEAVVQTPETKRKR